MLYEEKCSIIFSDPFQIIYILILLLSQIGIHFFLQKQFSGISVAAELEFLCTTEAEGCFCKTL